MNFSGILNLSVSSSTPCISAYNNSTILPSIVSPLSSPGYDPYSHSHQLASLAHPHQLPVHHNHVNNNHLNNIDYSKSLQCATGSNAVKSLTAASAMMYGGTRTPSLSPSSVEGNVGLVSNSRNGDTLVNTHNNSNHSNANNLHIVVDSPRSISCRSPSPSPSSCSSNSKDVSGSPGRNSAGNANKDGAGGLSSRQSNNGSPATTASSSSSSMATNPYAPCLKPKFNCDDLAKVECHLENKELWDKFHELGTEMIITKTGR